MGRPQTPTDRGATSDAATSDAATSDAATGSGATGGTPGGATRSGAARSGGTKSKSEARARAAAQREAQRKAEQRRRTLTVGAVVLVVLAVIAGMVAIKLSTDSSSKATAAAVTPAPAAAVQAVSTVPAAAFAAVGAGTTTAAPKPVTGPPLLKGDKTRVVYLGAEYCPYCAAERWTMVAALSRFGTFSGLQQAASSSKDVNPSTPTFSFRSVGYDSKYLSFEPVETATSTIKGNSYEPLQTPTAEQQALFTKYQPEGGIPFVDIGNKFVVSGAGYDGKILQGKTFEQIAAAVRDPGTAIGKAVLGSANVLTADLCTASGNKAPVCSSPEIKTLQGTLGAKR